MLIQTQEPAIGAYTSISDLVLGFDDKVLQSAFKVKYNTKIVASHHYKDLIWEFEC